MLSKKSEDGFHAPKYSDNSIGVAKWSGLHEEQFDDELIANLSSFINYEAKRKGFNDSVNNRVIKDGSNMFHASFFAGWPHTQWNQAYNQGVADHEREFIEFTVNSFYKGVANCNS